MICSNCQTENSVGSRFCKKCGRPLTSNFITCKNGHNYDSNLAKCPYCPSTGEYDVLTNIQNKIPRAFEEKTMLDNSPKTVVDNTKTVVENNRTVVDKQDRTVIDQSSNLGNRYTNNNASSATVIITDDNNKEKDNANIQTNISSSTPKVVHNRKLVGWLVTFDLSEYGNDFKLYEGRNEIGAMQENDIVIQKEGISKRHCTILFRAGEFIIRDELSTNGTFINGKMIEQEKLKEGDTIKIGTVTLKFKTVF